MSKRNRREHGRIISVETLTRGDSLAADVAAGATSITVNDAGDFDEDGGWLYIGGQTVEYTVCDDDTGVITLADPLAAAGEEGDPVQVWSDLYDEVVDYQLALVELDGEYDNPDPVVAEVAEGVGDLPEGDRGKAGESCTLKRVADDEWEVVGVGGRPRKSRGSRWEQNDFYTLTAADITAGSATMPLSHRPNDEALTCYLAGVPQRPTNWTINYDAQTLTIPLSGWEEAGDVLWVHYAYRKGISTPTVVAPTRVTNTLRANGIAGAASLTVTNGASVTGTGTVLMDGSDATYLTLPNATAGQGKTTHETLVGWNPTGKTGLLVEARIKTSYSAANCPLVSLNQNAYGTVAGYTSPSDHPAAVADGPGWLRFTLPITDTAGFNTNLNTADVFFNNVNTNTGGLIYEAEIIVSWDAP